MELTIRSLWTLIHGMGFGGLYLMAGSGALVELYRRYRSPLGPATTVADEGFLGNYLAVMTVLAWHRRNIAVAGVSAAAVILLFLGVLLTFPPIADLF